MTTKSQADLLQQSDQLYARYVRALEKDHAGQYVAVSLDGRMVLGDDLITLADQASTSSGSAASRTRSARRRSASGGE